MTDGRDVNSVAADLDLAPGDALASRPEGGAQATGASALATIQAESSESGAELQAGVATDGIVAIALGLAAPPSVATRPEGRDVHGRFVNANSIGTATQFQPGNPSQLVHGLRSRAHRARVLIEARAALTEKRTAIVADLGGVAALSAVHRDAVERLCEIDVLAAGLASDLLARGALTPQGKSRAALGAFLQLVDRWQRLAVLVGLERRAKRVASLDDVAREIAAGRAQRPVEPSSPADDVNVAREDERVTTAHAAAPTEPA